MKGGGNRSWIAGALVAACTLALACVVALPHAGQPAADFAPQGQSAEAARLADEALAADSPSPDDRQEEPNPASQPDEPFGGMEYEPGVVLATLPAGVSPVDAVAVIAQDTGLEGLALVDGADAAARAATAAETPLLVELSLPEDVSVEDATALISASSAIDAVQPNFVYYLADEADVDPRVQLVAQNYIVQDLVTQATVNDAGSAQWELESIYAYHTGANSDANAKYAWDVAQANGAVGVAVIDAGFQADHPDLEGNVKLTYNATDGSEDVSEISGVSDWGHGTHVAGIVAARANNGIGTAGVSYNAQLLLVKGATMGSNGKARFETIDIAAAIRHIVSLKSTYKVCVINMSIAGFTDSSPSGWEDNTLIKAIDEATAAGIVVVCAAGNKDTESSNTNWPRICYPADYVNVVSVINLQENGGDPHNVSRYTAGTGNYNQGASNYNESAAGHNANHNGKVSEIGKNISAPGRSIRSTTPNGTYGYKTGTSMASPVVAGSLALAFAANPSLTASQATSLLYTTATDVGDAGWDAQTGYGEVNAYGLVSNAGSYLSGGTTVQKGKTITFTVSSGASDVAWYTSDSSVATVNGGVVTGVAGGQARITAGRLVRVFGFASVIPIGSQVVTVYDPSISPSAATTTVGGTTTLTMNCSQSGSWNWASSDASVATVTSSGSAVTVSGKKVGTATITATLYSNPNISTTAKVTVSALSLANATVTWPSTYTYNGSAQKPTPTVKVGSTALTAGTDFTVTYPSDCTSAGTKNVTIKPGTSGRCTGSKAASYAISKASLSGAAVTLSPTSYTYDGTAKTPAVTVKVGSRTLANGTDYVAAYKGNTAVGTATVTVTGKGNYTGSKSAAFTISVARQALYRLYQPQTGEHHYTLDAHERDVCVAQWGWRYEGIAWYCPNTGSTPVHRLYNRSSGLHHYTTDAYERDVCVSRWGWTYEGIAWYSDDTRAVPLYRLYHPSSGHHHYTMDAHERDVCVAQWGWKYEGVSWYGMK